MLGGVLLLFASALTPSSALHAQRQQHRESEDADLQKLRRYSFAAFVEEFKRKYMPGTNEWARRERIFDQRLREIIDFRSGPPLSWTKGVTGFMDYDDEEFRATLGYKRTHTQAALAKVAVSFRRQAGVPIPSSFGLATNGSSLGQVVRNQGSCGSCWAMAAVAVLEGHMARQPALMMAMSKSGATAKANRYPTLSSQAILSCTANPRHCGGLGGCEGATSELAFELVKERGLPLASEWAYTSDDGNVQPCKAPLFSTQKVGISGYAVLQRNKLSDLKQALAVTGGPIAVSVDAGGWAFYSGGIYSDRSGDGTGKSSTGEFSLNHVVALMGYNGGSSPGYWLIKNSWGSYWGESGFIRLEMKPDEERHCGWDYTARKGVACDGDPEKVWVCGTCGILYDSTYPQGVHLRLD